MQSQIRSQSRLSESGVRVALVAGGLGQGGAEKQLVYAARSLLENGIESRVYCVADDQYYEGVLIAHGIPVYHFGTPQIRVLRMAKLVALMRSFRPHIIQSTHLFTNLYAACAGRLLRTPTIGAVRGSIGYARQNLGLYAKWLLVMTDILAVNSSAALRQIIRDQLRAEQTTFLLPNVIDLEQFDNQANQDVQPGSASALTAIYVGRLEPVKRVSRFLYAIAEAHRHVPELCGRIVGTGSEIRDLQTLADRLGLMPDTVEFLGPHPNVPSLLQHASVLILCSDDEGMPNVIIEAMAARIPVITTPAGDAGLLVQDGQSGYVVGFEDVNDLADRLVHLARSPSLRRQMGNAGRKIIEAKYDYARLFPQLLALYGKTGLKHARFDDYL